MRKFLLIAAILLATSGSVVGQQIPSALGWFQIPSTNIRTLCPSYPEIQGNGGCTSLMNAWNGGLYDTLRDRFVIFGGGHHDYFGNELYSINVGLNPITKTLLKDATHNPNMNGVPPACPDNYSDGSPVSRHIYGGFVYIPTTDRYLSYSGARSDCGFFTAASWEFNPATATWSRGTDGPGSTGSQPIAAYDSVTDSVYAVDNNVVAFWKYAPATRIWTNLGGINAVCLTTTPSAAIDPGRRFLFCVGGGQLSKISLSSPFTATSLTGTGCSAWKNTSAPGIAFDPVMNRIVGWAGGNTAYIYNPDTDSCTTQTFSGGPTTIQANGTYGRFQYSPSQGVFVVVNDVDANTYSLRLDTAQDTDFYNRCHATGVFRCVSFDTDADFTLLPSNGDGTGVWYADSGLMKATRDPSISTSGSSLRFELDPFTGSNVAGYYRNKWPQGFGQNSTFYVQYRFRISPEMINQNWGDPSGNTSWKVDILHYVTSSSDYIELTTTNHSLDSLPIMYTESGARGLYTNGGVPPYLLQQGDYNCSYGTNYATDPGCFKFPANTWMTFYYKVSIGTWGQPNSSIQAWVGVPGQPLKLWVNLPNFLLNHNDITTQVYNSIDLLNYMTAKNPALNHPIAFTWYDEFIASTSPIAAPSGQAATNVPSVQSVPTSLSFGSRAIGTTSTAQTTTLTNTGTATLTITSVALTGANLGDFGIASNTCTGSIAPTASCTTGVTFTPTAPGSRIANLTFTTNAASSPDNVLLSGTGTGLPVVGLSPTSINFGNQPLQVTSSSQNVTLSNSGTATLNITSITLTGANLSNFSIFSNGCTATLAQGNSCIVAVRFTPSAVGARTANLTFTTNAASSPNNVPLSGTGQAPVASFNPSSVSFGGVKVGLASTPISVVLTNVGNATMTISVIGLTGANASEYSLSTTCGPTLAVSSSCSTTVTFSPLLQGTRSANLSITSNTLTSPDLVPLTGVGFNPISGTGSATGTGTIKVQP